MTRLRILKLCLLVAITLLAAFLRLHRIDSLPPSDGYDQATYGLDVLDILDGARPIFLPTNFGREALYSYLVTLCYLAIGDVAMAVYVTSALVGTLTIPAVYLAAEELFRDEKGVLAQWGGLLAALALAISRWHLSWSRLGMRAILVPFFAAITVYLLWRGLRTGSRWAFLGCGLSLGLSMHSYQAARALPLLVLLGYVYVAWSRRSFTRRDMLNLAIIAVAALVVFAPLGVYFVTHSGSSGLRIGQAVVVRSSQGPGENARILLDQGLKAIRALFFQGDEDGRVNVPGWPALDPFMSVALLLGIAIGFLRLKRPAYPLLLTWLVGLSAPALLAQYGPVTKRAIGATPAVAILVALGCLVTWDTVRLWAERRHPSWARGLSVGLALLVGAGFVYSGVQTYRQYFVIWPQDPNLFTHFETGQTAIGRYIKDRPPEERIYLSPVPVDHHSVALNSGRRPGVKSYHGKFCFVAVDGAPQGATYVIVPAEDVNSLPLLAETLPQGSMADEGPLHYNQPYFVAYRVPAGARAQVAPAHQQAVNWDDKVQLLGYDLEKADQPGETLHLTLYYRPVEGTEAGRMEADYTVFVHLLGPDNPATGGPLWAQDDSEPCRRSYRTSAWGPNEIVIDRYAITIPPDAPPAEYQIAMGLYEWQTLERLPVLDAAGQVVGDHVILTSVNVGSED